MKVASVSFTGNSEYTRQDIEEKKKKVGEAAVGGGALAAASNKAGFRNFNSAKKLGFLSQEVTDNIKFAQRPIKESKSLFSRFGRMAREFTEGITSWAQKAPVLGKVVKSKIFLKVASGLGFGLALMTLATGLTNIVKTTSIAYNDHLQKSQFLNSLAEDDEN